MNEREMIVSTDIAGLRKAWVERVMGFQFPPAGTASAAGTDEERYVKLFQSLEAVYLQATRTGAGTGQDVADMIAKARFAWNSASDAAAEGRYSKAASTLQTLASGGLLQDLLKARRDATGVAKPTRIMAQRKFLLTRWARIPGELRAELQRLQQALEQNGSDDDPAALVAAIDDHQQTLLAGLRDEIDAGITAGEVSMLQGLRQRVEQDRVLGLLLKAPAIDGSRFKRVFLDAMDEIEKNFAA